MQRNEKSRIFHGFLLRSALCEAQTGKKTCEKTRLQNLVRHKSGCYYARAYAGGKEVWRSLRTSHFSVAQAKLADFLRDHRARVGDKAIASEVSAKITFGEALTIHQRDQSDNVEIKPSMLRY